MQATNPPAENATRYLTNVGATFFKQTTSGHPTKTIASHDGGDGNKNTENGYVSSPVPVRRSVTHTYPHTTDNNHRPAKN